MFELLGLGGRPLLDGLGDRPLHDDRHRPEGFRAFLDGLPCDRRALPDGPLERNLPVLMALLGVWYSTSSGPRPSPCCPTTSTSDASPPTSSSLDMESNGKSVTPRRPPVDYRPARWYWGEPGTNGQHAFYQLLHEGTRLVPCDFIGFCTTRRSTGRAPRTADGQPPRPAGGPAFGKTAEEVRAEGVPDHQVAHRVFEGNRPTNTILAPEPDPVDPRPAHRPLRAQGLHPGRDLGHQLVRPMGGRARQGARPGDPPRAGGRHRADPRSRQLHQRPDPPLPVTLEAVAVG